MFRAIGLFSELECPVKSCELLGCLFAHPNRVRPAKRRKVDVKQRSVEPVKAAQPVEVSSARTSTAEKFSIKWDPTVPLPHETRLHFLRLYKKEYERIYAPFSDPLYSNITAEHAIAQESSVMKSSTKMTYKSASKNALIALQKRVVAVNEDDVGIYPSYKAPESQTHDWKSLVHSVKTLKKWGYITEIPVPQSTSRNEERTDRICDRCGQRFIVSADEALWLTCSYHPGRPNYGVKGGTRVTGFSCCEASEPCATSATHVFKVTHPPLLASYCAFRELPETTGLDVVALDCEMVYTTASMELARVSIVDTKGTTLLDEFVLPRNKVLDYNTRFSGVTAESLKTAISRDEAIRHMISIGVTKDTIIIGHGLENDLNALRVVHAKCIDSAILFPHPRGAPYRNALKFLVKRYLNKDIQMNSMHSGLGHDPTEDAIGALDLVVWKLKNGNAKVGDDPFRGKLR